MGLDNIPKNYPCKTRGTAVLVEDERIDCKATQACGGCPWQTAVSESGIADGAAYGMFGTDCWYRGKYGNFLLAELGIEDEHGFYGDNEDGTEKSPESCVALADRIAEQYDNTIGTGRIVLTDDPTPEHIKYAEWWLRWVAKEADGSVCWY